MEMHNRSILIFRTGQLGDTLVSLPAIKAIKDKYPDHEIYLLTDVHPCRGYVSSWDVLGPTQWFTDVIVYEPQERQLDRLRTMFHLKNKLSTIKPEHIFDFSQERNIFQTIKDRLFFRHLINPLYYHVCRNNKVIRQVSNSFIPEVEPEWQRFLNMVESETNPFSFHLGIPDTAIGECTSAFQRENIRGYRLIAIAPGSKMLAKRWPKVRYAEVGKKLLGTFPDVDLIVLGGKEDEELGNELCQVWGPRSHNLAGKLSIYGSAAALKHCMVYVGNDTGTMHLAAMVGTSCVAIFSARDNPGRWEPYGNNHVVFRYDPKCAGCMLEECTEYQNLCMKKIETDEVFEAAEKVCRREHETVNTDLK